MRSGVLPPRGCEALDSPACDPALARATLRDVAKANTLFGGRAAVTFGLDRLLVHRPGERVTILDVGAGMGDILGYVKARRIGIRPLALDWHREAARLCRTHDIPVIVGDVRDLPLGPRSVDVVVVSQLLHHLTREELVPLLQRLHRAVRIGVVIADIERRRSAAWGIWLASFALAFHRVSRRDGVISVRRGFTCAELTDLLREAGLSGTVHRRPGFRIVAVATPSP